jgi:hypothetical protein
VLTSAAQRDEAQSVLAEVSWGDPEPGERLDRLTRPAPRDGLELIVFVPVSTMPDWLQAFAEASPVTLTANAARTYALDGGVPGSLAGSAAWIIGLLAIFIPLCVWRCRRMS